MGLPLVDQGDAARIDIALTGDLRDEFDGEAESPPAMRPDGGYVITYRLSYRDLYSAL
jgi:hypothetical protein